MKKIIIFTNNLEMGGVEKSLLDFILKIKKDKNYNLKLVVLKKNGSLKHEFESLIEIEELRNIYENLCSNARYEIVNNLKHLKFIEVIRIIFKKIYIKWRKKSMIDIILNQNYYPGQYDVAICYQVPIHPLSIYVSKKVDAKIKLLWNHAEINSVSEHLINEYQNFFTNYNKIYSVSEISNENCKKRLPSFSEKCDVFHNYINIEQIIDKSNKIEDFQFDFSKINLLTVGRLSPDKGYDLLIESAKILVSKQINFVWYIIGEGELRKEIEKQIIDNKIENYVVLLGKRENPYYFMKHCNIYVQTSRFEGYGLTTLEAKILKKLIITTNTSGIDEKFDNEHNALIVDKNPLNIANSIIRLIKDYKLSNTIKNNIDNEDIKIIDDFHKLYDLIANL